MVMIETLMMMMIRIVTTIMMVLIEIITMMD